MPKLDGSLLRFAVAPFLPGSDFGLRISAMTAYSSPERGFAAMPDDKQIHKRMLLRVLGSPLVVGPFMIGATAATAGWAMSLRPGLSLFAALAGAAVSVGMFFTRLVFGGAKIARCLAEETTLQAQRTAQESLDHLDRLLTEADDDPRPETALRDLRALLNAFDEAETSAPPAQLPVIVELRLRVNQLFAQCVQSTKQTGRLWETARRLNTPAARQPLLAQRERIIADVQATVKQLSETLVGVQSLGAASASGSSRELARLREELDRNLAVAQTVEQRVNNLLDEAAGVLPGRSPTIETTPHD